MTVGMFSPYLPDHFGGGERHFLTTAAYLTRQHRVEILLPILPPDLKKKISTYQRRFDLDLSKVNWRASKLASGTQSPLATWRETAQYDVFFHLTNGSLFFNGARRGILHVQIPFSQPLSLLNRWKLKTWQVLNTNSKFTQGVIEKSWGRRADVVHAPFVDHSVIPQKLPVKQPEILTVGRLFAPGAGHNKRQDVLIRAFIRGCQEKHWDKAVALHVVGAVEPGPVNERYVQELQELAQGWPIHFHLDVPNEEVLKLYQRCRIYWHAAGFEINEKKHPEWVEHFGMTPLEAMAWGCIPIVVPKGGLNEVINAGETGLTYQTIDELIEQTDRALHLSPAQAQVWQQKTQAASQTYSLSRFYQTIDEMIGHPSSL